MREFIDNGHPVSEQFFDIMEKPVTKKAMLTLIPKIRTLIEEDPEFYDSYAKYRISYNSWETFFGISIFA